MKKAFLKLKIAVFIGAIIMSNSFYGNFNRANVAYAAGGFDANYSHNQEDNQARIEEMHRARDRAYAEYQKEVQRLERARAYRAEHRDEINARARAYREDHRDEVREKARANYANHREERKARARAYRAAHRDEINARARANRAGRRK